MNRKRVNGRKFSVPCAGSWLLFCCLRAVADPVGSSTALASDGDVGAQAVGFIGSYKPRQAKFTLIRSFSKVHAPIAIGMPVHAGDRVHLEESGSVLILLNDGTPVVANTIGDTPIPGAKPNGALHRLFKEWTSKHGQRSRFRSAASATRSECESANTKPISIAAPLDGSKVLIGTRDIPVAWSGGCGPFTVMLEGSDGFNRKEEFAGTLYVFQGIEIGSQALSITVKGFDGSTARATVVGARKRPRPPPELQLGDTALGRLTEALWLRNTQGAEWRFEALGLIQLLVEQRIALAEEIAAELLQGDSDLGVLNSTR